MAKKQTAGRDRLGMQMSRMLSALFLAVLMLLMTACAGNTSVSTNERATAEASREESTKQKETEDMTNNPINNKGRIPTELELIPESYYDPADHPGTLMLKALDKKAPMIGTPEDPAKVEFAMTW